MQDLPASAPVYDGLTGPQTFPKPVCIATTDRDLIARNYKRMQVGDSDEGLTGCRCNTQQGTRLEVSFGFCMSVVQNGYFDDTKPDRGSPQDQRNQQPPPSTSPAYQPSQQQAGTTVTRVPYEKERFLW
ncbi:MAG: hypothetical protein VR76_05145 [Pseudomonas sp. BRH_c35]|nr:MAG: hypothetical protein VR76_05145 [Pseudomonas sp. BRH_c35]